MKRSKECVHRWSFAPDPSAVKICAFAQQISQIGRAASCGGRAFQSRRAKMAQIDDASTLKAGCRQPENGDGVSCRKDVVAAASVFLV
jgi:hypothetical protein